MACGSVKHFVIYSLFLAGGFAIPGDSDSFHEELFIRNLQTGHVYSYFQFTTLWNQSLGAADSFKHFHLFPKALGEVIHAFSVRELHLSLTQGSWRHESWGYPILDAPTGAELWTWFLDKQINIDSLWMELINVLSGMFCASLNFMDMKTTITPKFSFRPQGVTTAEYDRWFSKSVRYASLPRENVCTENLTPWKKLLPCGVKTGLSTLLNALKLYDTSYHSLAVHFRPVCVDSSCTETRVELTQTLSIVFDPIVTFGSSSGKFDWTMKKLFGRMITTSCPLASTSAIYVDIGHNSQPEFTLRPTPSRVVETRRGTETVRYAFYNVPEFVRSGSVLNLDVKFRDQAPARNIHPPALTATRFLTGYGQATGGITCLIYNNHPNKDIVVSYMELIPWFIRMYFHTLKVEHFQSFPDISQSGVAFKPLQIHYHPGKDRQRPYHLELVVRLPAASVVRISFEFERQLLKWTEYPPDANHGFYIGSAVIGAFLPDAQNITALSQSSSILASLLVDQDNVTAENGFFTRLYTVSLLVSLPTPDFSMPYNVICLACTVIAIAFGSIHNLTTRRFVLFDPIKHKGLLTKIKEKVKDKLARRKGKTEGSQKILDGGEQKTNEEAQEENEQFDKKEELEEDLKGEELKEEKL